MAWAEELIKEFIFMKIERGGFKEALKATKERLGNGKTVYEVFEKLKRPER